MSTVLCTKEMSIKVNPDPTFQGLTWEITNLIPPGVGHTGAGTFTASGTKERFSAVSACPSNPSTVHYNLQLTGASIVLPPSAQTRNCSFHIDVANTGNPAQSFINSLVYGDLGGVVFTGPSPNLGYVNGSSDFPFVIPPGATAPQRTLTVVLTQIAGFLIGPPTPCSMSWTGYLYVASYT